jgi:hypothetical protein
MILPVFFQIFVFWVPIPVDRATDKIENNDYSDENDGSNNHGFNQPPIYIPRLRPMHSPMKIARQ